MSKSFRLCFHRPTDCFAHCNLLTIFESCPILTIMYFSSIDSNHYSPSNYHQPLGSRLTRKRTEITEEHPETFRKTIQGMPNVVSEFGSSGCHLPTSHFNQNRISVFLAAKYWTVPHHSNSFLSTIANNVFQTPIRIQLYLIDSWSRKTRFLHLFEVIHAEIGDAD